MNRLVIEMGYPGSVISVNHYKHGYYTKLETKTWMDELGWKVKSAHLEDWRLPLSIRCDGRFKDRANQPDLSNLSKVILDALQEASGVNDRDMRWQDGDVSYGEPPTLTITITAGR